MIDTNHSSNAGGLLIMAFFFVFCCGCPPFPDVFVIPFFCADKGWMW